jgi:hypothetical protein
VERKKERKKEREIKKKRKTENGKRKKGFRVGVFIKVTGMARTSLFHLSSQHINVGHRYGEFPGAALRNGVIFEESSS